jgi:hypothetical protein
MIVGELAYTLLVKVILTEVSYSKIIYKKKHLYLKNSPSLPTEFRGSADKGVTGEECSFLGISSSSHNNYGGCYRKFIALQAPNCACI